MVMCFCLVIVCCFASAPFTLQRLCELITEPRKHYKKCDKFLRGVEKVKALYVDEVNGVVQETCLLEYLGCYNS